MMVRCERCTNKFDDADRSTLCPHHWIMPPADLMQKEDGLALIGHSICFAHQPDGPSHRVQSVSWNGMVTLHDMTGEFVPHLFVIAKAHSPDS